MSPSSLPRELIVRQFICSGDYQENCYLLAPRAAAEGDADRPCWIVDPGGGAGPVLADIVRRQLRPRAILLTHGHFDHLAGIPEIRRHWPALSICIGRGEADALQSPQVNLSARLGLPMALAEAPDRLLDGGDELTLGDLSFRVISADGHSPGGLCYYCRRSGDLFTGDVLFAGSIGRTDLPGGDAELLLSNIREKLLTLPEATRVWPGHGPATTIGLEKASNPFLQGV